MDKFKECSVLKDTSTIATDNTYNYTTKNSIKNNLFVDELNKHILGDMNVCYGFEYPTKEETFNRIYEIIRVLNKITNPET